MTRKSMTRTLSTGKIHQGDCVKLMQKLDDGSVDLVFADPPFNIGYKYDKYDDGSPKFTAYSNLTARFG